MLAHSETPRKMREPVIPVAGWARGGMGPRGDVLFMRKLLLFIVAALVIGVVVGAFVLSQWSIPAPKAPVEKTIPDEKFPH